MQAAERENGREELREKGALLRHKNNLEIHIKTNKVKHFRPLQQRKRNWWTKKRGEKNPFGEEREADQNHEEGSKSRKMPASSTERDICAKLVNYQFAFKRKRAREREREEAKICNNYCTLRTKV